MKESLQRFHRKLTRGHSLEGQNPTRRLLSVYESRVASEELPLGLGSGQCIAAFELSPGELPQSDDTDGVAVDHLSSVKVGRLPICSQSAPEIPLEKGCVSVPDLHETGQLGSLGGDPLRLGPSRVAIARHAVDHDPA